MVNQVLIDYIKKELGRGVSEDKVRLNLFKKKWSEPEIEDSLRVVKGELGKENKKKEVELLKKEVEQLKKQVSERLQNIKNKKRKHKKPILALVLSFIYAGLGQFYNGEKLKGILFLIGYSLGIGSFICYALYIYSKFGVAIYWIWTTPFFRHRFQKIILLVIAGMTIALAISSITEAYIRAKSINKKSEGKV